MATTLRDLQVLNDIWDRLTQLVGFRPSLPLSHLIDSGAESCVPLTLFVNEATGNDNNPGTEAAPMKSIVAAVDRLPKRVRHLLKVGVAPGNYQGFTLTGFTIDPAPGVNACGIVIYATGYATAALTQGSATGTLTATSTGNSATPTFSTVTDNTQNWAVNELKGKLLEVGSSLVPINSNTATEITLESSSVVGSIGATYTIRDWAVNITTPTTFPGSLTSASSNPVAGNAGICIRNNAIGVTNSLIIEGIRVNMGATTGLGITVENNTGQVFITRCAVGGAVTGLVTRSGSCVFSSGVINPSGLTTGVIMNGGAGALSLLNTLLKGSGNTVALQLQGSSMIVGLNNCHIEGFSFGMKILGTYGMLIQGSGTSIDTNGSSQCIMASALGHSNWGGSLIQFTGLECKNASAALHLGGAQAAWIESLQANNCTTTVIADRGARVQLGAASTITGGTTNISMDGVSNTLAAMRAASPKLLRNDYGTVIFE